MVGNPIKAHRELEAGNRDDGQEILMVGTFNRTPLMVGTSH